MLQQSKLYTKPPPASREIKGIMLIHMKIGSQGGVKCSNLTFPGGRWSGMERGHLPTPGLRLLAFIHRFPYRDAVKEGSPQLS